jgi:hypothetical protein
MHRLTHRYPKLPPAQAEQPCRRDPQRVDHYLGPWNSDESKREYDRLIGEWLARGKSEPEMQADSPGGSAPAPPPASTGVSGIITSRIRMGPYVPRAG